MTHPTLVDVLDELRRGGIIEAPITAERQHVSGFCDHDTQLVCINPLPELADTIAHELIHRRYPRWGEKRVRAETKRLLTNMTDADVAALVKAYRRRRHRRRLVRLESS